MLKNRTDHDSSSMGGLESAKEIMNYLKETFGPQNRSTRQHAMKGLMSTTMVEGT